MAVSIDTVYQKVLALANKEQRGYITPQEFNLFADMAQKEIFEQYFYDINQWTRQHGNDYGYSDMLTNLEEKVALFEHVAIADNITIVNKWGDANLKNDLPDLYRMGGLYVKYPENGRYVEAEAVTAKEFREYTTHLTKSTRQRPVYFRYAGGLGADRVKIYPYPVEDDGSDINPNTDEYTTTPVAVTSIIHAHNSTGRYFRFPVDQMNQLLGYTLGVGDEETFNHYRGGTLINANLAVILWNDAGSNSLGPNDGHGRIYDYAAGTDTDFQVGDTLDRTNSTVLGNKRNVKADYIKIPSTPRWGYVLVNEKALYNSGESENFQLHQSEESELVYKILKFAGISLQKQDITQAGQGMESTQLSQEKQ